MYHFVMASLILYLVNYFIRFVGMVSIVFCAYSNEDKKTVRIVELYPQKSQFQK